MIISASRRTDIPAYYSEWFYNRIKEGYVLVRNPMNIYQVSEINLDPKVVDCIVFWTKNPDPMLENLSLLNNYRYYFQFTLTSYDKTIEKNVPKKAKLIESFINLSQKIGKDKVIWRYDPIFFTEVFNIDYHIKYFEYLCARLCNYTNKCIISFLDMYSKTQRNLKNINILPIAKDKMIYITQQLVEITNKYGLILETCSEDIDLSKLGVQHGKCIDDRLISQVFGIKLNTEKDKNQREICGCVSSIDIGAYNTCDNNCLYCYANYSRNTVEKNLKLHNPMSPFLLGEKHEKDVIRVKEMTSFIDKQLDLFNM